MRREINFIKSLPNKSGVYLFLGQNDRILYVGKALNLKKRVSNYFDNQPKEERIRNLLIQAEKIDFIETLSEIEALLLEARLIKQHRPKYNTRLKDDKRYLYVGLTKEKYPQIALIRHPEKETNLLAWYGPFPSAASIKEILRLLRRVFPYRSCRKLTDKPCLYYHLNLCPAMCLGEVNNYPNTIEKIRMFLDGQIRHLIRNLKKEMEVAAKNLEFERANQIKKQIQMIEILLSSHAQGQDEEKSHQQTDELRKLLVKYSGIEPNKIERLEAYDVANLGEDLIVGSMIVFQNGEPSPEDYRQFNLKGSAYTTALRHSEASRRREVSAGKGDPGGIKQILSRRLTHSEWLFPQVILVDGGKTQIGAAVEALRDKKLTGQIPVLGLAKKEEKIIIPKIIKEKIVGWKTFQYKSSSLVHQLLQQARDEAHRFAQRYYKKIHRKITFPQPASTRAQRGELK